MKALIIDDERSIRKLYRQILEEANFEVVEAASGDEGIALYRSSPFDVVITDLFMPKVDGLTVIRTLRSEYPQIKIIGISGGPKDGSSLGTDAFLPDDLDTVRILRKPIDVDLLLGAVNSLLSQSSITKTSEKS